MWLHLCREGGCQWYQDLSQVHKLIFFRDHTLWWDTLVSLDTGGGAWSCLMLVSQTLLTPEVRPYLFLGVDGGKKGRWRGTGKREGGGN